MTGTPQSSPLRFWVAGVLLMTTWLVLITLTAVVSFSYAQPTLKLQDAAAAQYDVEMVERLIHERLKD